MSDADGATDDLRVMADRVRAALTPDGPGALGDLLDPDVTWGECIGAAAVIEFVAAAASAGVVAREVRVDVVDDRIVAELTIGDGSATATQAIFVRNGRITEIVDAEDRSHAVALRPVGDLAVAAQRPWDVVGVSPVLPVTDLAAAVDRYRALGFDVSVYEGDAAYAFVQRGSVELHLAQFTDLDPGTNSSASYLYVDDADAVHAAWRRAAVDGRLVAPTDTEYGLREGAYVDPDGNLLRFGSPSDAVRPG